MNMALLSMLITLAFSACERMNKAAEDTEYASLIPTQITTKPTPEKADITRKTELQQELEADAQLARTMPLVKYAGYMQSRKNYYSQFEEVKYQDEFVKIEMEAGELKVETNDGSASLEESK